MERVALELVGQSPSVTVSSSLGASTRRRDARFRFVISFGAAATEQK
jgi:hypothetical protein